MLFIFAGYFPTSPPDYKYDVIDPTDPNVDTNLSGYKTVSTDVIKSAVTAGGAVFVGIVILGAVLKQQVAMYVGVGMFAGLFTGIYYAALSTISNITSISKEMNYIFIVITIGIGILVTITVIDMFTGGSGGN